MRYARVLVFCILAAPTTPFLAFGVAAWCIARVDVVLARALGPYWDWCMNVAIRAFPDHD